MALRPDLMERRGGLSVDEHAILEEFAPVDETGQNG
jgi:hypothetical protein